MSFTHYRAFTIDHLKVNTGTQTNFPVRLAGTYAWAAATGSGGRSQNASGFDLRPFSDTGLSSAYTYQLTSYNATTGAFSMVVLVPSLSASADTLIYVGLGDAALTTDGSSTGVWDANFIGVYPHGDGTTLSLLDATSNGNNLTNVGTATATAGVVAGMGAVSLNGTTQSLEKAGVVVAAEPMMFEALFNPSDNTQQGDVVSIAPNSGITGLRALTKRASNSVRTTHIGTASTAVDAASAFTVSAWNYAASTFTSTTARDIHPNGVTKTSGAVNVTSLTAADRFAIGCRLQNATHNTFFVGAIGEVRISNVIRADSWIKTTKANLVDIATFYSVGSEVAVGGGSVSMPAVTGAFALTGVAATLSKTTTGFVLTADVGAFAQGPPPSGPSFLLSGLPVSLLYSGAPLGRGARLSLAMGIGL